jgi:GT2 family glycosyltransferase/glycosyltransferase involved in cell wall biosynthesis
MLKRIAKLVFLCLAPILLAALGLVFLVADLWTLLLKHVANRRSSKNEDPPALSSTPPGASIIIPNWNGKDLLEKFLPSVIAAAGPSDELIVVDNASVDGSAEFVRQHFPQVRVLEMPRNLGFGGGCNAGAHAARNPVVVMLNNDMRVEPDFVRTLLDGFTDPLVFAVSAQIFFSDPARRREETGLTAGWFAKGFFRVRHDIEERVQQLYPAFYAGGGSSAYDREKFLELGGFDSLFEPFYLEDTDLSYNAWKRGWKVVYQPGSRVYHEHRGTIGKHFPPQAIQAFLQKNYVLMVWKNVHSWPWMCSHLLHVYGHMLLNCMGWETATRTTIGAFILALKQLPQALRARRAALARAVIDDREVFRRNRPSVFREAFLSQARETTEAAAESPERAPRPSAAASNRPLNILIVSPYSIYPPLHGGAVFMQQTIQALAERNKLFLLTFVDSSSQVEANRAALKQWVCHSEIAVRKHRPSRTFHIHAHAQQTFHDPDFAALLDKMVLLHHIDVIQFEYTQMAQYRLPIKTVPQCLFEHDIYFRSVQRQLSGGSGGLLDKSREALEWLRGLRYEVAAAERFDAVFTCHEQERRTLESLVANGRPRIVSGLRTAIDVRSYSYPGGPRRPDSLLFVGNFQHRPNVEGLQYFVEQVLPIIRARRPHATLTIVGANAGAEERERFRGDGIRMLGQAPDIREPLSAHAVFVCPIRTGAGVRVKILEAFASGIPVVSTSLGAEGLAAVSGEAALLADSPAAFANACIDLLSNPAEASAVAARARQLVEDRYDLAVVIRKLEGLYQELVASRRGLPARPAAERHDPIGAVTVR